MAIEHRYIDSFDTVGFDVSICDWQTANQLTDHKVVKCTTEATHWINDPDEPGITYLCLAHADLYRTIMKQNPKPLVED